MWWKRLLIGLAILIVGLYAAIYAFLHFYDVNRFKPRITNAVRDATGRQFTIAGDLEIDFGLLPVLAAENIAFENASWGSRPEMIRIKRFQVRVALLPLLLGKVEIASILLIDPDILLEKNAAGDLNIPAGSGDAGSAPAETPLIHSIEIQNARLAFRDGQTGRHLDLELDHLRAELPDTDSPLEIDLEGTFNRTPVAIFGSIGRPLPAFLSGRQLPAALSVEIAGNRFQVVGAVDNTADFSGLDWKITGSGDSIPGLGRLAGMDDLPDPGPFTIQVRFSGSPKHLTMSDLNLQIGDRRLANVFVRGRIGDLLRLQEIDVQVIATGDDLKQAGKLFATTIPWQGEFRATGRLIRSGSQGLRLDDVLLTAGDNDVAATVELDLQQEKPRLSATVHSRRLDLRPLFAADAFQRTGSDEKTGRKSKTSASREDKPPEPILKRFNAGLQLTTGTIFLPKMIIHELDTSARLENGRISVQTKGPRPPDLKELAGISALPELGPIRLSCDLVGTARGLSLRNVDLKAGSLQQARVTVSGSIAELLEAKGFGLDIRIEGDDASSLEKYLLEPWPLRGKYAVSTRMVDSAKTVFTFDPISGSLEDIDFNGSLTVDASGDTARVAIAVNAPRFNLRPFALPGLEMPDKMKQVASMGPLDVSLVLTSSSGTIGIANLQLKLGGADLLAVSMQGAVNDVKALKGISLELEAGGREVAGLETLFGESIPLQGPYALRTSIHDPAAGIFRFDALFVSLADNQVTGFAELDRSGKPVHISGDLSASEIDLTDLVRPADFKTEPDDGKFEKAIDRQLVLPQWPVPPQLLQNLDADIRLRADRIKVTDLAISGLEVKADLQRAELNLNAAARTVLYVSGSGEVADDFQMGGVALSVNGRAAGNRMAIDSFKLNGGGPETVSILLEGSAADTIRQTGINLRFDIHGQEAGYLWQLLDTDFRATGPFSLSGSLADPQPKQYRFEDLKAAVGKSSIDGRLEIDYTGKRPKLSARISTPYLDLRPYLPEVPDPAAAQPAPAAGSSRSRKVFSKDPWHLGVLEKIDLAVSLDAAQLYAPRAAVKDLRFELAVDDANLVLKPLQFSSGGGTISGELTLRTSTEIPTLNALIEISDYDVGRDLDELGRSQDIQGSLSGRIQLKGPAESTAAFMGGLNGRVAFSVTKGKINNRIIGVVYGDISDTLLNMIRPVRRKDPFIDLNCLVQSFEIRNGQAQHLGLLDTTQTALVTVGTIDLTRERLNVTLRSSPKSGIRFGSLGRIGISLKEFTRPFKLSGTLARPSLAVDTSRTALTIGKLLGGLALGPAGIAAILTDISAGEKNPCLVAMEALEKGGDPPDEKELIEDGGLLDQATDALIEGGQKVIEEGEKTIKQSP